MRSHLCVVVGTLVACVGTLGVARAESITLPGLSGPAEVDFDPYGIPHIYAQSWPDAAGVIGYLHARDRLWQMDVFRRQASGTLAEIFGPDRLASDILMRQLAIRAGCEALWKSGSIPEDMRRELVAYADGVNAWMQSAGEAGLPAIFKKLGYKPAPWSPVDTLCFSKYMGWDQSGTMDDLWFGAMVEKLGVDAVEQLWPLERPYEIPTVKHQADRSAPPTKFTLRARPGDADAYLAAYERLNGVGWLGRGGSFGSNNWAVDGTKTVSGKPILCSDPHLGFDLPSIWYAAHLSVKGENLAGVTFPVGPGIVIGHNDHIAWGITNMQADAVDFYVETINPADVSQYRHRGAWKALGVTTEQIPVRGRSPHELRIERTAHGPIVERGQRTVSLAWTGLPATTDAVALWRISHARNLQEFLSACDLLIVPCINLVYADVDGNIAIHPCGALPVRSRGQGRMPLDGASGDDDWTAMIPRARMPLSINPPEHYVASANGRPAPLGFPYYLGWMWDDSYRTRRINDRLARGTRLTPESMRAIQNDAYDLAASRYLPVFLEALAAEAAGDDVARQARRELAAWGYVADVRSRAPALWLRWFSFYRDAVWQDEWAARGIKQPGGSWGFSGDNRREPMLEVLEFLTREAPQSHWFDDRTTPERESRDAIIRRAFGRMVASIRKDFGDDPAGWEWGRINRLKIDSLTGAPELRRAGVPLPGTSFTLNPGSNVGTVGGGASWRMIVDLSAPEKSQAVYPGGQSEDPSSRHYDDQIPVWASGRYLPLDAVSNPDSLPPETRKNKLTFTRG
jgi:penicillin amidase